MNGKGFYDFQGGSIDNVLLNIPGLPGFDGERNPCFFVMQFDGVMQRYVMHQALDVMEVIRPFATNG